jgi:Na+-translocating ferredoxin:NAD+ oxidoreductase RnfA subunit
VLILTGASITADILGHVLMKLNKSTLIIISFYVVIELLIVQLIFLKISSFKSPLRLFSVAFTVIVSTSLIVGMAIYGVDQPYEFLWSIASIFECVFSFLLSILIIINLKIDSLDLPIELWVLAGIFIYTTFSIVPLASFNLRLYNDEPELGAMIYEIFIVTGNIFKDICFGIYALLLTRKKPGWTIIQ